MPPVFSSAGGAHNGGESSLTWSHTVADEADRILLVGTMAQHNDVTDHVNSVTYNGVALTLLLRRTQGAFTQEGDLWYLISPDVGTHDVVATHDVTTSDFAGVSVGYRNVHQTNPFGNTGTTGGSADPMTQDIASSSAALVVDVLAFTVTNGVTAGGGQTQRGQQVEGTLWGVAMSDEAGAATVTMSWSPVGTTLYWNSLVAELLSPAAASGGIVFNLQIG